MTANADGAARRILILGAGYAGLTAAQAVGKALHGRRNYQVLLVDRRDSHELKPKLPEAVGEWTDCSVQVPIRDVLDPDYVRFFQTDVTDVDPAKHVVFTEDGALPYWRLVIALGAQPDFAPDGQVMPGAAEVAIAPYNQGAACHLRHHMAQVVEEASLQSSEEERDALLTVVVAGAGFVGVEMAGQLADRLKQLKAQYNLPAQVGRVILVEPRPGVLGFEPELDHDALDGLVAQGVDVRLGAGLAQAWPDRVRLSDGTEIRTRTLVWTGGVRGTALAASLGLPTDDKGHIHVDASLRVRGWPDVYAIGDGARCPALDQRPELVNSGQSAVAQGRFVARAIQAETHGKAVPVYVASSRGAAVLLGYRRAVARLGPWTPPVHRGARWVKQLPTLEHLWRIGGVPLLRRHWSSTILPLITPRRLRSRAGAHIEI